MPRKTKDAPGRVTPKGGPVRRGAGGAGGSGRPAGGQGRTTQAAGGRYTAPIPREFRSSPWWVPVLILTFFGLGLISILLNYLGLLPGGANNWYLILGLGLIVAGFIAATRYH
ncbi:MAG TPA: cell division protein CrgA [Acidimicrobiales bacterium]|nr:cell division protein CrgA [Acidimicrobiales bacterium]